MARAAHNDKQFEQLGNGLVWFYAVQGDKGQKNTYFLHCTKQVLEQL